MDISVDILYNVTSLEGTALLGLGAVMAVFIALTMICIYLEKSEWVFCFGFASLTLICPIAIFVVAIAALLFAYFKDKSWIGSYMMLGWCIGLIATVVLAVVLLYFGFDFGAWTPADFGWGGETVPETPVDPEI